MTTAKLAVMANHPNRGRNREEISAANPTPAQVAKLRAEAGLTLEAFGQLVYKSLRTVQDWEAGLRRMPPDTWELVQVKLRARDLLKRGRLAPLAVRDLGLQLPED